jgi:hypothetical protein
MDQARQPPQRVVILKRMGYQLGPRQIGIAADARKLPTAVVLKAHPLLGHGIDARAGVPLLRQACQPL